MLKIIVSSPHEGEIQPVVWNYDEVRAGVADKLAQYKDRAYTPDTIRGAKADRAALNKLRDAVADARRSKKKEYLAPFAAFEAQCKEIEGMIADTGAAIDRQIKAFEAEEAEQKKAEIQACYDEAVGELRELVPLEAVWSHRWLNKTYSMRMIREELCRTLEIIAADLNTIRQTCGMDTEACISEYMATQHNINKALDKHRQLEELRSRNRYDRLEQLKTDLMARDGARHPAPKAPAAPQPETTAAPAGEPDRDPAAPAPTLKHMDFRVWYYDRADLLALREFLNARGMRFNKVPVQPSPAR